MESPSENLPKFDLGPEDFPENPAACAMLERLEKGKFTQDQLCGLALTSIQKFPPLDGTSLGLPNFSDFWEQNLKSVNKKELIKNIILLQVALFPKDIRRQDGLLGPRTLGALQTRLRLDGLRQGLRGKKEKSKESYASFSEKQIFLIDSLMKVIARNAPNKLGDNGWSTKKLVDTFIAKNANVDLRGKTIVLGGQGNHFNSQGGAQLAFEATKKLIDFVSQEDAKVLVNLRVPYDRKALDAKAYASREAQRQEYARLVKAQGWEYFDQEALYPEPPACPKGNVHPSGFGAGSYYAKTSNALAKRLDDLGGGASPSNSQSV